MLAQQKTDNLNPSRVVVIGANSFVAKAAMCRLATLGVETLCMTRRDVDFVSGVAVVRLSEKIHPDDSVLIVAAKAPAKNAADVRENIGMMANICAAIEATKPIHVTYISSDAVYADSDVGLTEDSTLAPDSLHGVMHLAREIMLRSICEERLAILRPTLIYGPEDPHNGYGPNRFARLAKENSDITLFGEGEERRDHVYVEDVGEIICRVVMNRATGTLNVASGVATSFFEIAERITKYSKTNGKIKTTKRIGAMPHNGYRPFDVAAIYEVFPDFNMTSLEDGLRQTILGIR